MTETTTTPIEHEPDLDKTRQGEWAKYSEIYESPTAYLSRTLRSFRRWPETIVNASNLPPDRKEDDPLPLVDELTYLFRGGAIGDIQDGNPLVTDEELFAAAPVLWGLDEEGMKKFKTETLPLARARGVELLLKMEEERLQSIETGNRFFIQTWDATRLDKLATLLASIPENKVPTLGPTVAIYKNTLRPNLTVIAKDFDSTSLDDEPERRRAALQQLSDRVAQIAGRLTFLTDSELRDITGHEQFAKYLFLDTLADITPALYQSAAAAKRKEVALRTVHYHHADDRESALLSLREQSIATLLYGAPGKDQVRSLTQRLLQRGDKIPGPAIGAPLQDK